MALTWDWNEKCGEAFYTQKFDGEERGFNVNLYEGNAFLIMVAEYEQDGQDKYSVKSFWVDKQHMKRCLGLDKKGGYARNIYFDGYDKFTKFRIDKAKCRHWKDIVPALAQAFDNLTIELFTGEEN